MAGWFELMTSLLPVYRFTFSWGLETAEWPGLVVVARRTKARVTSIQEALFNPPTTCLLCPYNLYGQRSGAHSRQEDGDRLISRNSCLRPPKIGRAHV